MDNTYYRQIGERLKKRAFLNEGNSKYVIENEFNFASGFRSVKGSKNIDQIYSKEIVGIKNSSQIDQPRLRIKNILGRRKNTQIIEENRANSRLASELDEYNETQQTNLLKMNKNFSRNDLKTMVNSKSRSNNLSPVSFSGTFLPKIAQRSQSIALNNDHMTTFLYKNLVKQNISGGLQYTMSESREKTQMINEFNSRSPSHKILGNKKNNKLKERQAYVIHQPVKLNENMKKIEQALLELQKDEEIQQIDQPIVIGHDDTTNAESMSKLQQLQSKLSFRNIIVTSNDDIMNIEEQSQLIKEEKSPKHQISQKRIEEQASLGPTETPIKDSKLQSKQITQLEFFDSVLQTIKTPLVLNLSPTSKPTLGQEGGLSNFYDTQVKIMRESQSPKIEENGEQMALDPKKTVKQRPLLDFSGDQAKYFQEKITAEKFKKLFSKEISPQMFKEGKFLGQAWKNRIAFKYENKLYPHLLTFEKWEREKLEEEERRKLIIMGDMRVIQEVKDEEERRHTTLVDEDTSVDLGDSNDNLLKTSSSLEQKQGRTVRFDLNKQTEQSLARLDSLLSTDEEFFKKNKRYSRAIKGGVVIKEQTELERSKIMRKIQDGVRLDYNEMNAVNIALQFPNIKQRYLMNKNTGLKEEEQQRITLLRQKRYQSRAMGSLRVNEIKLPLADEYVEFSSDNSEVDEYTGNFERISSPYIEQLISENIDYSCPSFKKLVFKYKVYLETEKNPNLSVAEAVRREKQKSIRQFRLEISKFIYHLQLRNKFLDKSFFEKRYENKSTWQRHLKMIRDYEKYEQPISLRKEQILGYIKDKIQTILLSQKFQSQINDELALLSPQKNYQNDLYVNNIIQSIKNAWEADISERVKEADRLRKDTLKINEQIQGGVQNMVIMPNALQISELFTRMKEKVSKNALLEVHKEALQQDSENQGLSIKEINKGFPDIEMLYAKMCDDQKLLPTLTLLKHILFSKNLRIHKFRLSQAWLNILQEILQKQQDPITDLSLEDNQLTNLGFKSILESLLHQRQLKSLIYQRNELGGMSIRIVEEFLANKKLQVLSIISPKGMTQEDTIMLFEALRQAVDLEQLDLVDIPYFNKDQSVETFITCISESQSLNKLNLSRNKFKAHQITLLLEFIANFPNYQSEMTNGYFEMPKSQLALTSLNISHNSMRPSEEKHCQVFYETLKTIIDQNQLNDLNLEWMQLGDKALDLCESIIKNYSLISIHLSNNSIDESKLKWFFSIGIDVPAPQKNDDEDNTIKEKEIEATYDTGSEQGQEELVNPYENQKEENVEQTKFIIENKEEIQEKQQNQLHNIANLYDLKSFRTQPKQEFTDGIHGGTLILSRVLGHNEFQSVQRPLFTDDEIKWAYDQIVLTREEEIKNKFKTAIKKTAGQTSDDDSSLNSTKAVFMPRDFKPPILNKELQRFKDEKYEQKRELIKWSINESCWNCEKYKYSVIFYKRSTANIWFQKESFQKIPASIIKQYRQKVDLLNEINSDDVLPVIDPVLIGDFELSNEKQLIRPYEYFEPLMREYLIKLTQNQLKELKNELRNLYSKQRQKVEYQNNFTLQYADNYKKEMKDWMPKFIDRLKYPKDTVFLTCPSVDQRHDNDLFMSTGFLKPGRRTLRVLDNYFNEETKKFEIVAYKREFLIQQMTSQLMGLNIDEQQYVEKYIKGTNILQRYNDIQEYLTKKPIMEQQRKNEEQKRMKKRNEEIKELLNMYQEHLIEELKASKQNKKPKEKEDKGQTKDEVKEEEEKEEKEVKTAKKGKKGGKKKGKKK